MATPIKPVVNLRKRKWRQVTGRSTIPKKSTVIRETYFIDADDLFFLL